MAFYNPLPLIVGSVTPAPVTKHTLTIRYLDEGGNPIQSDTTVLLEEGASYSYTAPSIEGYTPVVNSISGTMGTSDTTVSFTYTAVTTKYTLTIHYWDISSGSQVAYAPDYVGYYASGEAYSITSPSYPDTYRCDKPVVAGTMPSRDSSVNVYYTAAAPAEPVNLNNYSRENISNWATMTTVPAENQAYMESGPVEPDAPEIFKLCTALTVVDMSRVDMSNVTDMKEAFYGCSSLTSVNLAITTSGPIELYQMFRGCTSLTTLDLSVFHPGTIYRLSNMFYDCSSLTSVDLSNFDVSSMTVAGSGVFRGCNALTTIKLNETWLDQDADDLDIDIRSGYTPSLTTIYVPSAYLSQFKASRNWKDFASLMVGY